jgi:hypothetical protein
VLLNPAVLVVRGLSDVLEAIGRILLSYLVHMHSSLRSLRQGQVHVGPITWEVLPQIASIVSSARYPKDSESKERQPSCRGWGSKVILTLQRGTRCFSNCCTAYWGGVTYPAPWSTSHKMRGKPSRASPSVWDSAFPSSEDPWEVICVRLSVSKRKRIIKRTKKK